MYQQERMDEIMKILRENHYVTVDYLVKEIKYSPASIRRDLTLLEKQGLLKRSYGGAQYLEPGFTPFRFRQYMMKPAKNAICKKAATLVKNGDVVFLDGSTTAQYMGQYLLNKKGITVVTCNMHLADFLSERGVTTYCTGGKVVADTGTLGGNLMLESLSHFNIDICFFSSNAFSLSGQILWRNEAPLARDNALRQNSKKLVLLCGSDKIGAEAKYVGLSLADVDYFVSDANLPESLKKKFKETTFLCTK